MQSPIIMNFQKFIRFLNVLGNVQCLYRNVQYYIHTLVRVCDGSNNFRSIALFFPWVAKERYMSSSSGLIFLPLGWDFSRVQVSYALCITSRIRYSENWFQFGHRDIQTQAISPILHSFMFYVIWWKISLVI